VHPPEGDLTQQVSALMSAVEELREDIADIRSRMVERNQSAIDLEQAEVEEALLHGGIGKAEELDVIVTAAKIDKSSIRSAAIVDWTAVRNSCLLIEGVDASDLESLRLDPFLAFADLAATIGAVVFYDRVLVLGDGDLAWRANRAFGLGREMPVVGIQDALTKSWDFGRLLTDSFRSSLICLDSAEMQRLPWLDWLRSSWERLLPDVAFPPHTADNYYTELGYDKTQYYGSGSYTRESLLELFQTAGESWRLRKDNLGKIVLDNDVRALFYEYLSSSLTRAFSASSNPLTVSYIGGCLRSPLLLARARYAEASLNDATRVEGWLYEKWRELYVSANADLRMPFWLSAAVASSSDRSALSRSIGELRTSAKSLRKTRTKLDERLRVGDRKAVRELTDALRGDARAAIGPSDTVADLTSEAVSAASGVFLPAVPADLAGRAISAGLQSSKLREWSLQLFRPHLGFIVRTRTKAMSQDRTLQKAAKLFDWPRRVATEPKEFLGRLSDAAWIA
jgi:hypothetical protein